MTRKKRAGGDKLKALASVATQFAGWQPGRDVLTPVRSVPTIFPQFDVATRVGGCPIQRVMLVHGPSNHGKTVFLLGLGRSFLAAGHYYFHVDAEMTTPQRWVQENLGQLAGMPTFLGLRPSNYEETAERVRTAALQLQTMREKGHIPEDTSALFGIDSLQKLVPRNFMEALAKQAKKDEEKGVDPMKGRGGQFMAAMNTAWMRELIPLLYHCNAGIVLISRERDKPDAGKYEVQYEIGGGKSVYYDSSLACRVTREGWVERGEKEKKEVLGERHRVTIHKTKVGPKDARVTNCYFHTSNGRHTPVGFDQARDVVDLGLRSGVLKQSKGTHEIVDQEDGTILGKGVHEAVLELSGDTQLLDDLRARVVAAAKPDEEEDLAC